MKIAGGGRGAILSCRTTLVDGFDQGQAAPSFTPIAYGAAIGFDCSDEVLQHSLMRPMITDYWRRWAGILIHTFGEDGIGLVVSQSNFNQAILLENHRAFGTGQFDAPRIAGIYRCCGLQDAECATLEFQYCRKRIFRFDRVKFGPHCRLHVPDLPEEPQKQVDCMDSLIDESCTSV